ncbi:MAG: LysR family transcriptional regulator [Eubacteriales bacterium]|nr:LysR family transcriptional regulator [Eubacteriales bacterium]
MDISYLKEFVVLAEIGNYLRAADALFISQSSLSKHIKALEKELGLSLFERSTRKIQLSPYGETLLPYARKIVNLQYQYTVSLMNQSGKKPEFLSIGSVPSVTPYGITDKIIQFQTENKKLAVELYEGESDQLLRMLRQNRFELAFVRDRNEVSSEFAKIPFAEDTLAAIMRPNHPLASRKSVSLEELKDEHFLFLPPNSLMYNLCMDECHKCGFTPRVVYSGHRAETILDLVTKGMGTALLMRKPIDCSHRDDVCIVDIEPKITTHIQIYYKKDAPLSAAAKHFIAALQSTE